MRGVLGGLAAGLGLGAFAAVLFLGQPKAASAGSNDRHEDFVMTTGAVQLTPRVQTDGVWLLDYKSGKLLGTVIDKALGKIVGWAEVDLVSEFEVAPKQDVHFLMTTGWVSSGQSALYVAETTTGKFGVYTMGPNEAGGVAIRRHDMTSFRQGQPKAGLPTAGGAEPPAVAGGAKPPAGVTDPMKK
ncbi:MAG: hypothetical protein ABGY75_10090 [Gemmataceae bacterium]